jgi:hypothetical protein
MQGEIDLLGWFADTGAAPAPKVMSPIFSECRVLDEDCRGWLD